MYGSHRLSIQSRLNDTLGFLVLREFRMSIMEAVRGNMFDVQMNETV